MTFAWPLALARPARDPDPGRSLRARRPQAPARRRAVREPGARPEPGRGLAGLAAARRSDPRARRARPPRGRGRATARRARRHAGRGDDRARDRHLALDGGDDVQPTPVRGGQAGGPRVPRRGARQLQRGNRLLLDLGRSGAAADDRPRRGTDRARRAPARLGNGDRRRRSRARSISRSTGGRAGEAARPASARRRRCSCSPTAPRPRATSARSRPPSGRAGWASRSRRSRSARGTPSSRCRVPGGLKERVVVAPDVADAPGRSRRRPAGRFSEAPSAARLAVGLPRARHPARARPQARRGDLRVRRRRRGAPPRRQRALLPLVQEGAVRAAAWRSRCCSRPAGRPSLGGAGAARAANECRGLQACLPGRRAPGSRSRRRRAAAPRTVVWEMRCPLRGYIVAGIDARVSDRAIDVSIRGENGAPVSPGVTTGREVVFTAVYTGGAPRADVVPAVHRLHPDLGGRRRAARRRCGIRPPSRPSRRSTGGSSRKRLVSGAIRAGRRPLPRGHAPPRREPRLRIPDGSRAGSDAAARGERPPDDRGTDGHGSRNGRSVGAAEPRRRAPAPYALLAGDSMSFEAPALLLSLLVVPVAAVGYWLAPAPPSAVRGALHEPGGARRRRQPAPRVAPARPCRARCWRRSRRSASRSPARRSRSRPRTSGRASCSSSTRPARCARRT